ncbi:MAG: beta-hexosaminidase [Oscillospiraceae bacterium]|nr:beta-hexosaminidase [Oscillospiraceae bacterium]
MRKHFAAVLICAFLLTGCTAVDDVSQPIMETASVTEAAVTTTVSETTVTESEEKPWEYLLTDGEFSEYYDAAYAMLSEMSREEKVGQLLLARCPDNASEQAEKFRLGGYVLFKRDVKGKTPETLREFIGGFQSVSKIPMICAVDEEGGEIVRVSSLSAFRETRFPSPSKAYKNGGFQGVYDDYSEKSGFLLDLGFNLNLAPVADVSVDPKDYIYSRTLGLPAEETAEYIRNAVTAAKEAGISSCLKHFPGYGNNADTHTGSAIDERSEDTFRNSDFLPFKAGIEAGAECVLVSHNIVKCFDSEKPASLSPEIHRILREELGFSGIIMTDDLSMDAVSLFCTDSLPYAEAVNAGNDILIVTEYEAAYNDILSAVESGEITQETIDRAVMRIIAWKYSKGLLEQ